MIRRVIILGSTGSVGTQTLDVVGHLNALHDRGEFLHRFEVVGLAARSNVDLILSQSQRWPDARLAIQRDASDRASIDRPGGEVQDLSSVSGGIARLPVGSIVAPDAAELLVRSVPCDLVVASIVGSAGLASALAAVELGRDLVLANKEALVSAGALVVPAAVRSGSRILPIDSEHSALWQCLARVAPDGRSASSPTPGHHDDRARETQPLLAPPWNECRRIRRAILTASGGPFRTWPIDRLRAATPDEALRHPTWSMGRKVTVDSASLMNKALEIIEAHWLFGIPASRLEALVHPQSIVHAIAEYDDGGAIAHLAPPDMRIPIQHALAWPDLPRGAWPTLDWTALSSLEFSPPDLARFPALGLASRVIGESSRGTTAGAILNAANECAVQAFLSGRIPFGAISDLAAAALDGIPASPVRSLADVTGAESLAHEFVRSRVESSGSGRARANV